MALQLKDSWESVNVSIRQRAIFLRIYLFIFGGVGVRGRAGSSLLRGLFFSCGEPRLLSGWDAQASHCRGCSYCAAWALVLQTSAVAARGPCGTASIVVAHGFICSSAFGIFQDQGSKPCLLHWQAGSLPHGHQGSPKEIFFFFSEEFFISRCY